MTLQCVWTRRYYHASRTKCEFIGVPPINLPKQAGNTWLHGCMKTVRKTNPETYPTHWTSEPGSHKEKDT